MRIHVAPADVDLFVARLRSVATGRAHAWTAKRLRERWGYNDRVLRALVHAANEQEHLVVASDAGYFIPTRREELDEPVRRLRSQALEMMGRAKLIEDLGAMAFDVPVMNGRLF